MRKHGVTSENCAFGLEVKSLSILYTSEKFNENVCNLLIKWKKYRQGKLQNMLLGKIHYCNWDITN